jgi:hypothetical protein
LLVLKYSTGTGWIDNRKQQLYTTQHEPFLPSKSFQTENTGLTPRSVFTSDKDEYQKQLWTEQTSESSGTPDL